MIAISDTEFARKRAQHDDNDLQNNDKQETSPLVKVSFVYKKFIISIKISCYFHFCRKKKEIRMMHFILF